VDFQRYYRDHFDLNSLWPVISKDNFSKREFGFQRMDIGFTRNKSFEEPQHLKEYLSTFPVMNAYIGSVYKDRLLPKDRYYDAITIHNTDWIGRDLIFDLDLDEYDPVRTCKCKGREVCEICWAFMQDAANIMDETFAVDFGFKKRIWVYTGGRGYHCWILDADTFDLDQNQRTAIVEYMQLIHDPKGVQKIDDPGEFANLLVRRIYRKIGRKYIMETPIKRLEEEAGFTKNSIAKARERLKNSELVADIVDSIPRGKENQFLKTVILNHYPRIDHKVTIDIRRLIRMPGSIHAGTGNISEYVNPITFNPAYDAKNLYDVIGE
jgi:DNA primase small subunit